MLGTECRSPGRAVSTPCLKFKYLPKALPQTIKHKLTTRGMGESHFPEKWEQTGALWPSESSSDRSLLTRLVFAVVLSSSRWRRIWCLLNPVEGFSALLGKCCWKVLELHSGKEKAIDGRTVFRDTTDTGELLGNQGIGDWGVCELAKCVNPKSHCALLLSISCVPKEVQNVTMVSSVPTQRNNVSVLRMESRRLSGSSLRLFSMLFTICGATREPRPKLLKSTCPSYAHSTVK